MPPGAPPAAIAAQWDYLIGEATLDQVIQKRKMAGFSIFIKKPERKSFA